MSENQPCRICFKPTDIDDQNDIYGDDGKIVTQIFLISGVKIVEISSVENAVKICYKCLKQLRKAIEFRDRCQSADNHYRKISFEAEEKCWNNKLNGLQHDTDELCQIPEINVKCEPLIDEFNDNDMPAWNLNWFTEDIEAPLDEPPVIREKRKYTKKTHKEVKVDSKKSRTCPICNEKFSSLAYDAFSHHLERHRKFKEWAGIPCSKCDQTFLSHWSYGRHINRNHPTVGNLICDVCGKSYPNRLKLKDHLKDIHIYKRRPKTDTSEKKLPCTICGKFFKGAYYLKKHENLHNKLKPSEYFYCDLCGNKFKEKAAMHTHIRFTHLEKRRFHCPDCPGRSWSKKNGLKRHISSFHQNIREHKCDICGKEFHALHGLKNHYRIHTGEHRYQCKFCDRKFIHNTDCRRHEWNHTGYRGNIKCPNCNQGFFKNSDLRSHLSRCFAFS